MKNIIGLEKQNEKPLLFPEEIEKYFSEGNIVIDLYPQDIISEQEQGIIDFKATSATQYYEYITSEIAYWTKVDPGNKLNAITNKGKFQEAKNQFDYAMRSIGSPSTFKQYLNQSVANVSKQTLSSKTKLAQILLQYIDKPASFLDGFRIGMRVNGSSNFSLNADMLQGFLAAMSYRDCYKGYVQVAEEQITSFKNCAKEEMEKFSLLNKDYTNAFFEQEKRLVTIEEQTNNHFENFFTKEKSFFDSASNKLTTLEKQYQENLKLKAPAKNWEEMENAYINKGRFWIIISAVISVLTIALLVSILLLAPNVFSKENDWFETVKNSAIVTVITSICIYALRTTIKMAMSSFHLSRDAKERNKLSVFYLALIEDNAVTDKERAIILNALFSRSDTGLLKGDSSPTMTNNVSDLVAAVKNIKAQN